MSVSPSVRRSRRPPGSRPAAGRCSSLERLESRVLPATLTVNTAADENMVGVALSLREAIEVSNGTVPVSALSPQQQTQVSGTLSRPNTIHFDIGSGGVQTIALTSAL